MAVFTVSCEYFATGEGTTYMILFTRGYPRHEDYEVQPSYPYNEATKKYEYNPGKLKISPEEVARKIFAEKFGGYFARGAEVKVGLHFDSRAAELLISKELQDKLVDWNKDAGGFEYHSSLHVNFS